METIKPLVTTTILSLVITNIKPPKQKFYLMTHNLQLNVAWMYLLCVTLTLNSNNDNTGNMFLR